MARYFTKTNERLDQICESYYGDADNNIVMFVIESNPRLDPRHMVLPLGIWIELPDRPQTVTQSAGPQVLQQIRLW